MKLDIKNPFVKKVIKEDEELEKILTVLKDLDPRDPRYKELVKMVEDLSETRDRRYPKIRPEIWIPALVSIGGIVIVLHYEKFDVITSKAFSMIKKPW